MTPEILLSGFQNNCDYQGQIQGSVKGAYSSSRLLQQGGLGNTVQGTLKLLVLHISSHLKTRSGINSIQCPDGSIATSD